MASKSALQIARELDAELKSKGITATFKTDLGEVSIGAQPSEPNAGCTCGHYQAGHPKQGPDCRPVSKEVGGDGESG